MRSTCVFLVVLVVGAGCDHRTLPSGTDLPDGGVASAKNKIAVSGTVCAQPQQAFRNLLVSNVTVLPGLQPDTDADGLSDAAEQKAGTCPLDADSDGDGVGDTIEVKLGRDPLEPDSYFTLCGKLQAVEQTAVDPCQPDVMKTRRIFDDEDKDGLNACEEQLVGSLDTLFDSDGDGLPDKVEVVAGTSLLHDDAQQDVDHDGVVNRKEVRGHSDPRQPDVAAHPSQAYRYTEVDQGIKDVPTWSQPSISGVTVVGVSPSSSPGVGWLAFEPGPPPTLAWRDYGDTGYGPAVEIAESGQYKLQSASPERYLGAKTTGEGTYPADKVTGTVSIGSSKRACQWFRVENITLVETGVDPVLKTTGNNIIYLSVGILPEDATRPATYRVASVRVVYREGPPPVRVPDLPEIVLSDGDFVTW